MASVQERLKQLDQEAAKLAEERNKLLGKAKDEALVAVNTALEGLNALGYNYRLVEGGRAAPTGGSRVGTRGVKDAPCPICGFKTNPPHDKRSHRTQEPKKPFTDAELAAKGMKKVS